MLRGRRKSVPLRYIYGSKRFSSVQFVVLLQDRSSSPERLRASTALAHSRINISTVAGLKRSHRRIKTLPGCGDAVCRKRPISPALLIYVHSIIYLHIYPSPENRSKLIISCKTPARCGRLSAKEPSRPLPLSTTPIRKQAT
jgi:hypothetical protein